MFGVKFDDRGLIVQTNEDGGDCAARTGEYYLGLVIRTMLGIDNAEWPNNTPTDFLRCLNLLFDFRTGVFKRYIQPPYDYPFSREWGASRDQTMPLVLACILYNQMQTAKSVWNDVERHEMAYPNGDLCGPVDVAMFRRGLGFGLFGDLQLRLGDIQLYVSAIVRCSQSQDNGDDVGDDIGLTQYLAFSHFVKPTMFSKAAIDLYKRRRQNFKFLGGDRSVKSNYEKIPGCGIQYAFDHYHAPITGGNPLNELWRPIIEKVF